MMRSLVALLLAAVIAAPAWSQQVAGGTRPGGVSPSTRSLSTVWGQVRSERTGAPLRHALVEVLTPGLPPATAVTDSNGVYVVRDVPPGRRLLRATHLDHAPHEVEVLLVADRAHPIDFDLEFRPLRLVAVTAEGARGLPAALDTVSMTPSEIGPAVARVLESAAGVTELGLADAAREVPGHEPVDPTDVLYVRGGPADLKLVLLNGVPVYAPFHVGGLIHALDADVLRSATLYVGGAPARYDGGLSYVMDLESRSARSDRLHGRFGLDMLAGRALLEGPVGSRAAFLASARTVHGKGTPGWDNGPFPYAYGDAMGRADVRLGGPHVITATGFWNDETVRLDTVAGVRQTATWGNQAGSLRYRGQVSGSDVMVTAAAGRFRTVLPLSGIQPLLAEGTARRTRLALDTERSFAGGRLFWGGSLDRVEFEYRALRYGVPRDSALTRSEAAGDVAGAYGEAAFTILPRVRVRGGVRLDYYTEDPGVRLAPRLSATILLTDRAALTLMGGQYRQYIRTPERSLVFLGPILPEPGSGPTLRVAEATHFVMALSQDLGEGIRLGIEGFYKEFTGLQVAPETTTDASGVDIWVRRSSEGLSGWLGYSLAWVWAVDTDRPRPSQAFSGRQVISAGVLAQLFGAGMFDVRVSYGAGLPFTAIPEPEISNPTFGAALRPATIQLAESEVPMLPTEPQDPYIRVDAQVATTWMGTWGGFDFTFMPYLKVMNALNRRDAIFYQYNREAGRAEPLAGLPIMPVIGAEWRF
jgi:hypothetical protein